MTYALRYLFVLIWITYLICSGVYLFSRGFLLSRIAKQEISTCQHLSENPNDEYPMTNEFIDEIFKDMNVSTNLCLPKKSKIILLVIDALKYEFGLYNEFKNKPLPYENKIRIFYELLKNQSDYSRLYKFNADPPTTTLQRLKGLTTGTLPTFIDVGSNFATPEINEDNIIDQVVKNKMNAVFLGDSTWTDLYPKRFKRQYSYPSFDIYDLDTVDNQILKYLPNELDKNDWDILIAHFLGVDHCGHRYGPLHDEMSRKLDETDKTIRMVIDKMDSETTLFVISDHGMTYSGDHGGESNDEVDALLFAYSKSNKFLKINDYNGFDNLTMNQIDLVPTLATILGVPIPYSNLGQINFNLLPDINYSIIPNYKLLLVHAWQNAKQIYTYFYSYTFDNNNKKTFSNLFNLNDINIINKQFNNLLIYVNNIKSLNDFKNFYYNNLKKNINVILNICRDTWVKFDANQMSQGLLLTFLPIFFSFLLINNSHILQYSRIFNLNLILFIYFSNFIISILGYYYYNELSMRNEIHSIIFMTSLLSTIIFVLLIIQNWSDIAINWSNMKRFNNMPTRFIYIIAVSVFFSNSFIIQEQKILSYLLAALIIFMLYELIQENIHYEIKTTKIKFKFITFLKSTIFKLIIFGIFAIVLLRCAYQFFRCREEQNDCEDFSRLLNNNNNNNDIVNGIGVNINIDVGNNFINENNNSAENIFKTTSKSTREAKLKGNLLSVVILILYTILARIYLRSCGNLTGFSINVLLSRYGPIIATICAAGHILLLNSDLKNINMSHLDRMAWIVYALFIMQCIVIFICPLMTYVIVPRKTNLIQLNSYTNLVPELFKKMKQAYDGNQDAINAIKSVSSSSSSSSTNAATVTSSTTRQDHRKPEIPIVYGLATVYSSVLISFGVFLLLLIVILLDGRPSLGIFICIAVAAVILNIHSILRYRSSCKLETCTQPTFTAIVAWLLLGHFSFFATSHQTTLSQIEWRAAFVGRTSNYDNSIFLSGLLVILNTFGGQILFMILYSLLTSETFSIYALFPRLIRSSMLPPSQSGLISSTLTTSSSSLKDNKKNLNTYYNNNLNTEIRLITINKSDIQYQTVEFDITRGELILYENERIYIGSIFKLACQFFMLQGLRIFCAMMACTIHCRHLMVWKIFAPRFIYESIATLVSFPAIIIGYLIVIRLHLSVNHLINQINKTK